MKKINIAYGVTAHRKTMYYGGIDGIGQYTIQLYNTLMSSDRVICYPCSFFDTNMEGNFSKATYLGSFKKQMLMQILARKYFAAQSLLPTGVELFHATDHYIPKLQHIPVVATIHDVIPFTNPKWQSPIQRFYSYFLRKSMNFADHVITVSEYSKEEICRLLDKKPEDVSVIYNSFDPIWSQEDTIEWIKYIKLKYSINKSFIIFVGTIQKRKNLDTLINAMSRLPERIYNEHELFVIGKASALDVHENRKIQQMANAKKIRWLNYVNSKELKTLVSLAKCLVFPSFAEGFGIPIVESFAAGTPVIASNATSIPEIAGGAARVFLPSDADQLAKELTDVLSNQSLRAKMIRLGKARSKDFSWERSADETLAVYEHIIDKYRKK